MPSIYDTGPTALLPFRRKSYLGFLRSEKIHRSRSRLNPQTSDPVASMITTGPPGSTACLGRDICNVNVFIQYIQKRKLCVKTRCKFQNVPCALDFEAKHSKFFCGNCRRFLSLLGFKTFLNISGHQRCFLH